MSKHKQNVEDIQAEVKQLQEEVHKESYGSNESKRTGPVFDSIMELRNKLRLKQDENKKGNKDDVLKELSKLSDEVQTDKYDAKNYKGKGVGHDSIKIIRQNLIQMQEANKNWASSKEKLDKQIEDMKDMVSKFVFENCGEEKEKEAKTAFKNVKVQTPSTLIQLMLKEIKNVIDRLNTDDQEANTLAFSLIESACMLYATITGTEQVAVTSQTLMIQLNKVQVLHEKTTKKAEAVTEMVRMCNDELPIIYDKLMSIGFKQGAHPQEQNDGINKIKEYLNIIKHCVITTLESCIVVEQESVISTLEDMFKTVMGEQYKPTKSTHKVNERQGNGNDRNKRNETSTRETHAEFDNGFKVVINNMTLVIIERINRLETHAEHQNEQNRQMALTCQQMNAKLYNIQQTLESTENARLELLNRLSKVAGAKMVEGNPIIADLSDTNRPTKLSEKYSELYDNEWTDAFNIVSKLKKDEESAIKILLDILLEAYRFCENKGKEEYKLESIQAKMVADLRKQTAGESTKDLKTHFKKEKVTVAGARDCHVYADKCIELCWLMCLQSPPVFIGTKFDQKGKFDTNVYKPYSKSGKKYEFQVWPPLYLHEGGPLLSKGVAQGKK